MAKGRQPIWALHVPSCTSQRSSEDLQKPKGCLLEPCIAERPAEPLPAAWACSMTDWGSFIGHRICQPSCLYSVPSTALYVFHAVSQLQLYL